MTSRATLPTAPAATPSAPARSATRVRSVCQGRAGVVEAQPRPPARRRRPARRREPGQRPGRAAELQRRGGAAAGRRPAASRPASHPAALSPNVVGTACCSSVRPTMGVSRWAAARPAAASAAPSRSDRTTAQASAGHQHRRGVHDVLAGRSPVDVRGDVVRHRRPEAATSGTTGLPLRGGVPPSAAGVDVEARAGGGDRRRPRRPGSTPASAGASARAASTSSMRRSQAASATAARTPPRARMPSNRPGSDRRRRRSHRRPGGRCRTGTRRRRRHGDQRVAPGRSATEASTGSAALAGLVGEVDPGDHPVEQPAGEHRDGEVRRRAGQRTGLDGEEGVPPVRGGLAPREAAEPGRAVDGAARVVGVVEPPGGVGLPGLDRARPAPARRPRR